MRTGQKLSTGSAVVEQQQVSLPNNHFDFDDVDVLDNIGENDHDDNGDNHHDDKSDKMMTKWRKQLTCVVIALHPLPFLSNPRLQSGKLHF